MIKHTLISLLSVLSAEELKRLSDYLQSKYHVSNKRLYPLLVELIEFHPLFNDEKLTKQYLFDKLYPGKVFHDSTVRDLLSDLLVNCEKFLKVEFCFRNNLKLEIDLMDLLGNKKQVNLFEKKKKEIFTNFIKKRKLDNELLTDKNKYEFALLNFNIVNQHVKDKDVILKRINKINSYITSSLVSSFIEAVEGELRIFIYNKKYNLGFDGFINDNLINSLESFVLSRTSDKHWDIHTLFKIYIALYKAFKWLNKKKYFKEYRREVMDHASELSLDELSIHYSHMISYCILIKNSKNRYEEYCDLLYNLYNEFLDRKYYKNSKAEYINTQLYRDIIVFALNIKKYDWLREVTDKHSSCLKPSDREKMLNYAKAQLECAIGNPLKALEYINKINLEYFIYKYDSYNLKLKIYYLNEFYEEAICLIQTYKAFLRNNDMVSKEAKFQYKKYMYIVESLISFKLDNDYTKLDDIAFELSKDCNIIFKPWLKEEVHNLKNQKSRIKP